MDNKIHPKVQKLLDKSKFIGGKTLTGQPADEIKVYGTNVNSSNTSNKMIKDPNSERDLTKNYNSL